MPDFPRSSSILRLSVVSVVVAACCPSQSLQADTHHVPLNGDIQAAIDICDAGDIVQLAAGTYEIQSIRLRSDMTLQGSEDPFGATVLLSTGGLQAIDWGSSVGTSIRDLTVQCIDGIGVLSKQRGSGTISGCRFQNSDSALIIFDGHWEILSSVFQHCGPGGNLAGASCGAVGLHIGFPNGSQQVRFSDCVFADNQTPGWGGGIYAYGGDLFLENCEFRRNSASLGAAIATDQSVHPGVFIQGCIFEHNSCTGGGSAVHAQPGLGYSIVGCEFRSNYTVSGWSDVGGEIAPQNCIFHTCCTVDPQSASGHGNLWVYPAETVHHAMCRTCRGDFNCDASVDSIDLGQFLGAWGTSDPRFDLDESGHVESFDLGRLLAAWGACQ